MRRSFTHMSVVSRTTSEIQLCSKIWPPTNPAGGGNLGFNPRFAAGAVPCCVAAAAFAVWYTDGRNRKATLELRHDSPSLILSPLEGLPLITLSLTVTKPAVLMKTPETCFPKRPKKNRRSP